ncbi:hypothetical protein GWK47_034375 [Chionoecetes opilio]|uniref:Uncharacterized protein n=1 Tax=Chionoecetes opilio TaxID=41210 RepID=A0A8J4YP07_CHIOP|nr:hypothetical protein GWK47_034375 [Chionoecetes opilio]
MSLVVHVDRKHGLTAKKLNTWQSSSSTGGSQHLLRHQCRKVNHRNMRNGPKHILKQLRVMRDRSQEVQTGCDFTWDRGSGSYIRSVLLSLMIGRQTTGSVQAWPVHETHSLHCGDQIQEILVKSVEVWSSLPHQRTEICEAGAEACAQWWDAGQRRVHWLVAHHDRPFPLRGRDREAVVAAQRADAELRQLRKALEDENDPASLYYLNRDVLMRRVDSAYCLP